MIRANMLAAVSGECDHPSMRFNRLCLIAAAPLLANAGCRAAQPSSLEECRSVAAREAKTETGAKALLADCAKKFAPAPVPVRDFGEQECLKRGMVYQPETLVGPKCHDDPSERPCTAEDIAFNAQAKVSKAECKKRGDAWSAPMNACGRLGRPPMLIVCKSP